MVLRYLHGPKFSHFGTVPACEWQTDRQIHDDSIYRTCLASRCKNYLINSNS